jgi:hypothetical protein
MNAILNHFKKFYDQNKFLIFRPQMGTLP